MVRDGWVWAAACAVVGLLALAPAARAGAAPTTVYQCGHASLVTWVADRLATTRTADERATSENHALDPARVSSAAPATPIRIAVEFQLGSTDPRVAALIKDQIVPLATATFKEFLRVRHPASGPLLVPHACSEKWPASTKCRALQAAPKCLFATHDPAVLAGAEVCPTAPALCSDRAPGPGLADTDFLLYVTAAPSLNGVPYCTETTLALGAPCEFDEASTRPIAGVINFCPAALQNANLGMALDVTVHEMTHALGFTEPMLEYFVDDAGARLPADAVVKTITAGGRPRKAVVTPTVRDAARAMFGCPTAQGMFLEDDGGAGTAGSHWEIRFAGNELMTGSVMGDRSVLSTLTLALLRDTGWYEVDATKARALSWAEGRGCPFLQDASWDATPYCNGDEGHTMCSYDYRTYGVCSPLVLEAGVDDVILLRDGQCYDTNSPLGAPAGSDYGVSSRCFVHTPPKGQGGAAPVCLPAKCTATGGGVVLSMGGIDVPCTPGQDVPTPGGGTVKCPTGDGPCPYLGCPNDCNAHGVCVNSVCQCYLGFTGDTCQSWVAPIAVSSQAVSQAPLSSPTVTSAPVTAPEAPSGDVHHNRSPHTPFLSIPVFFGTFFASAAGVLGLALAGWGLWKVAAARRESAGKGTTTGTGAPALEAPNAAPHLTHAPSSASAPLSPLSAPAATPDAAPEPDSGPLALSVAYPDSHHDRDLLSLPAADVVPRVCKAGHRLAGNVPPVSP